MMDLIKGILRLRSCGKGETPYCSASKKDDRCFKSRDPILRNSNSAVPSPGKAETSRQLLVCPAILTNLTVGQNLADI